MLNFLVKYADDGRVTVPREIRSHLKLKGGTDLAMRVEGENIVISKPAQRCFVCGSDKVIPFGERYICEGCKAEIKKVFEDEHERVQ